MIRFSLVLCTELGKTKAPNAAINVLFYLKQVQLIKQHDLICLMIMICTQDGVFQGVRSCMSNKDSSFSAQHSSSIHRLAVRLEALSTQVQQLSRQTDGRGQLTRDDLSMLLQRYIPQRLYAE